MIHPASVPLLLAGACSLAACNNPDTVLFVTNSSLGINFDSKPPTANIAYDRTEGYIAPRYSNGGAPPVAASMETGGNIFNPIVRQSYVTGSAAVIATGGPPQNPPTEMTGETDKKKLMFVGTATTVGLKVGFAETGPVPDSLLFGYRRKEISVIPLGIEKRGDGTERAVYPSVIASIDMNTKTTDPTGTGMTSKQFFATGSAADGLVKNNPAISAAFGMKAEEAALAGLTPDQRLLAEQKSSKFLQTHAGQRDAIIAYLTKDGPFTTAKLNALIKKANDSGGNVPGWVERMKTADELSQGLSRSPSVVETLAKATQS